VVFLDEDGEERRKPLRECALRRFESGPPVRSFPSYRGQRNWPGWWRSSTTGAHVGFESWLERPVDRTISTVGTERSAAELLEGTVLDRSTS
jgi:hypothetical protein